MFLYYFTDIRIVVMISVYADILQALGIEYTFITAGDLRTFCFLYKLDRGHWYIRSESTLPVGEEVALHIKIHGVYLEQAVTVLSAREDYYDIQFPQTTCLTELFSRIAELEANIASWDKRKEQRYTIGVKNREAFLLRSNEQLLSCAHKDIVCLLDNISFSGCRVITNGVDIVPSGSQAVLALSFSYPIERIGLPASIVHSHTRTAAHRRFTFISMQFIHPVHLTFKKRLAAYIDTLAQQ